MRPDDYADYLLWIEQLRKERREAEDDDALDLRIQCIEGRTLRGNNLGVGTRLREDTSDLPFDTNQGRRRDAEE